MLNFILGGLFFLSAYILMQSSYERRNRSKVLKEIEEERNTIFSAGYKRGVSDLQDSYQKVLNKIIKGYEDGQALNQTADCPTVQDDPNQG